MRGLCLHPGSSNPTAKKKNYLAFYLISYKRHI